MIRLTNLHSGDAVYVAGEKVTAVFDIHGQSAGIHSGGGFVEVRERAEDVARLVDGAARRHEPDPPEATELRAFIRMAEKGVLPSLDSINGARRHLGYAELKELTR